MHRTKINSKTRINMHTGSPTTRSTQALDACKTQTMRLNPQTDLRAWSRGLKPSDFLKRTCSLLFGVVFLFLPFHEVFDFLA